MVLRYHRKQIEFLDTLVKLEDVQIYSDLYINKNKKMSSFKSNENIHKNEVGSFYVVSVNKASSVTL